MHESMQAGTSAPKQIADWTVADSRATDSLGWMLVTTGDGESTVEFQADDEMDLFVNDNEAIVHVLRRAKLPEGALERKALAYLARVNPEYYQDEVIDIERRMGLS